MIARRAAGLVAAGTLGCLMMPAVAAAGPVRIGQPVPFGPALASQSAALVQPSAKGDFSPLRRVVIPYFQLEVQSKGGKEASSKAFMSSMRNNVSVSYKIEGVDQAAMQALTDRLYADLVASFRARGIEVVDRADARQRSKNYAKLETSYQPAPKEFGLAGGGKSMFYAPSGMGLYMVGVENTGNGKVGGLGGLGGAFSGFAKMGNAMAEASAPTELDAAIVGVRLKVAFVETKAFRMNGFVSVKHRAALAVQPVDTQLWIVAPASQVAGKGAGQRVQFQLASAIVPAGDAILSVDDTQSTGKKVDTMLGNLIGGLSGTSSYKVEEYTVRLDPARFSAVMGETMAVTQGLLIDRLRSASAQ